MPNSTQMQVTINADSESLVNGVDKGMYAIVELGSKATKAN